MHPATRLKRYLVARSPLLQRLQALVFRYQPYTRTFRRYYTEQGWRTAESASGPGSTLAATEGLRRELPPFLRRLGARSLLDVPCGDLNWIGALDLDGIEYIGADLVAELIRDNRARHARAGRRFVQLDLLKDPLPRADVVLCRDCLPHYPSPLVLRALRNIQRSGATYLLATTFPGLAHNTELEAVGFFRPVNLERPPYNLPPARAALDEVSPGKVLALWKLDEVRL